MRKRVEVTLASLLILLCVGLRLAYTSDVTIQNGGVDLIVMDALVPFGKLERPLVRFPHEAHAAGGEEASCLLCHDAKPGEDAGFFFTFKGRDGLSREEIKDLYHTECINCHAEREVARQPTGPQVCSGCHVNPTADQLSSPHSVDFNPPFHSLHTENAALDCQACHDVFGEDDREELPDGHQPASSGNSSHDLCITCHLSDGLSENVSGPLSCTGCHEEPSISPEEIELSENKAHGGEVIFDHDLHEMADVSCEVCHHKEPETSCDECHADGDSINGGGVSLQAAMHTRDADRSCVGCHESMGAGVVDDCTGCHAPFRKGNQ